MKKKVLVVGVFMMALVLSACSGGFKADHHYSIAPFEFTNQNNEKVSLDDLKGDIWLAQFVFTSCTTVCPPMMSNMAELQEGLEDKGVENYKIVSFSVDPEVDTPEKLGEYLTNFDVPDPAKWEMLTGYKMEDISDLAVKSFKMPVIDDPNSDQVIHGSRFGLVNKEGKVVKTYAGNVDVPFDTIVKDMKALSKED
ncbi:SCO family protein [Sporosarcina aquimarina]|uniref:SCO family protein n=1 Tax=Sporosarcina aquimarina TaxID=114975 RepID=A0ABU4FXN8_9BACL|nr:SCO family protein [Sporosarcina aquimarina]MDW0109482.1 SCO family protein [Sporosarcina aquimarina]